MSDWGIRVPVLIAILVLSASPSAAIAQTGVTGTTRAKALPSRCASIVATTRVSDKARIAAQEIAARAQASSINGDNATATATELYRRDARAMAEYCRFLALAPGPPDAADAADVRQRIAGLAFALPPDTTVVRVPVTAPAQMPAPSAALGAGLIIPGLGQFVTHRPAAGLLVIAAIGIGAAAAVTLTAAIEAFARERAEPIHATNGRRH